MSLHLSRSCIYFFFFNDTATTEIYTLSLHDALPISGGELMLRTGPAGPNHIRIEVRSEEHTSELQSPYVISYAVFCLKKKNHQNVQDAALLHLSSLHPFSRVPGD